VEFELAETTERLKKPEGGTEPRWQSVQHKGLVRGCRCRAPRLHGMLVRPTGRTVRRWWENSEGDQTQGGMNSSLWTRGTGSRGNTPDNAWIRRSYGTSRTVLPRLSIKPQESWQPH